MSRHARETDLTPIYKSRTLTINDIYDLGETYHLDGTYKGFIGDKVGFKGKGTDEHIIYYINNEKLRNLMSLLDFRENFSLGSGIQMSRIRDKQIDTLIDAMYGKGLLGDVKNVFTNEYSRSTEKMLEKYSNYVMSKVAVYRTPIDKPIQVAIDALTNGKKLDYEKSDYDKLYHLYMVFEMISPDGKKVYYLTEKRPSIVYEMRKNLDSLTAGANYIKLNVEKNPMSYTYEDMISGAKKKLGKNFHVYSGDKYNCQNYIKTLLNSIGIKGADQFIEQPIDDLIKQLPIAKKIAKKVTDVASFVDRIRGNGMKPNMYTNLEMRNAALITTPNTSTQFSKNEFASIPKYSPVKMK